jgi:hypothetical protein
MATWDIKKTRDLIRDRFGVEQLDLARPSLQSLVDRQEYTRYHYAEINDLFEEFRSKHLEAAPSILALTEEGEWDLDQFILKSGAHGVACLQCLHSLTDILAHAVYYSLGINLSPAPLREREISCSSVIAKIRAVPEHAEIAAEMQAFVESSAYKHVAAAANLSKHRSVTKSAIHEDWTGANPDKHSVKFISFTHSDTVYPSESIKDVLQPVYDSASVLVVDVGNRINAFLASSAL